MSQIISNTETQTINTIVNSIGNLIIAANS